MTQVFVSFCFPPIPMREAIKHRWEAVTSDYEPGAPIGYGPTIAQALQNLEDEYSEFYNEPIGPYKWRGRPY